MTDLKTLQYPRHIHKGEAWKLTPSAEACDLDMDAGWVLSPGDTPRVLTDSVVETAEHDPEIAPDEAPVAPRRKPGRPRNDSKE